MEGASASSGRGFCGGNDANQGVGKKKEKKNAAPSTSPEEHLAYSLHRGKAKKWAFRIIL